MGGFWSQGREWKERPEGLQCGWGACDTQLRSLWAGAAPQGLKLTRAEHGQGASETPSLWGGHPGVWVLGAGRRRMSSQGPFTSTCLGPCSPGPACTLCPGYLRGVGCWRHSGELDGAPAFPSPRLRLCMDPSDFNSNILLFIFVLVQFSRLKTQSHRAPC